MKRAGLSCYQIITNATCAYPSLSGVDIPGNYVTQAMLSSLNPLEAGPGTGWANYSSVVEQGRDVVHWGGGGGCGVSW
ncbi:uncharacterized protein EKO05_0009647 [Ascochyta rabiei]|uniref:uncharacterized protein n=1 Tax=Didymella rabiei TaxID=5454 RepID=UPI0022032BF9|nr:uncharacterized protein EKO05_0009647 [Ascochyta rabiei]UPX19382.1 hypothetical protein EKO05_0009647 [Ascochyta rabiei]